MMAHKAWLLSRGQPLLSVLLLLHLLAHPTVRALEGVTSAQTRIVLQPNAAVTADDGPHAHSAAPPERALHSSEYTSVQGRSGHPDQHTAGRELQQTLRAAVAAAAGFRCPPVVAAISAPGCACTMHLNNQQDTAAASEAPSTPINRPLLFGNRDRRRTQRNVCPAGYRCSPSAAADIVRAGWQPNPALRNSGLGNGSEFQAPQSALGFAAATKGICVACQLGEYCPPGTQEESFLSLATCDLKPGSGAASGSSSSSQIGDATSASSCKGFKACPAGSYCPDATDAKPCEPGRFCPEGSITSEPCNISSLLTWNPFRTIQPDPQTLLESLVNSNMPLGGNTCPANTTSPVASCPPGYFCPTAAEKLQCPVAYFCPGHSTRPIPCPTLASCESPGLSAPDWSWLGLFFMLLLLLALLTVLEYVRVAGRREYKAGAHEEEVMQLIGAVGFKMVCADDTCKLQRVSCIQPHKEAGFRQQASEQAYNALPKPLKSAQSWVAKTYLSFNHWLANSLSRASRRRSGDGREDLPQNGSMMNSSDHDGSHQSADAARSKGKDVISDHTVVEIPDQHQHERGYLTKINTAPAAAADEGEYQINPRLTLVFREVWVADQPLDEGLGHKAISGLAGLCGCADGSSSSSKTGSSGKSLDVRSAAEARLDRAAARGVKFIVPGVSSKFAHTELHALMGPSGCGKTTLCKALAGRIPMSRVSGDIRVLCSSAADGFQSQSELAMAGSFAACSVACNISHMTGFVPQFDLLHETLTVQENLLQAAYLRLPVSHPHMTHYQRQREVRAVVGEVTALMALNKVTHQVVGSSAQRMISGGQRKRVAIGVELVAKPSLLWLDEPTSGLDAAVAYDVVEALKNSSQRGMNILAVMHQPRCSIFNMFDSCLLLSSNGHVVYSGPQNMAMHYMAFIGFYKPAEENTADFLMDVIAGVVPRPGNPDYVPSQLATLWQKCGDIWIQQQLQQQHGPSTCHIQRAHSMYHSLGLDQLPPPTAAAASAVDWPWRPRDLEALLQRFHLLVDNDVGNDKNDMSGFGGAGGQGFKASGDDGGSVLSYEGFLSFWDEAGVKDIMGEEQFAEFILGISDDFGMAPGKSITQSQFLEVLKAQLRAAAGVAQPDPFAGGAAASDDDDDDDDDHKPDQTQHHQHHHHHHHHQQQQQQQAEGSKVAMQVQGSLNPASPFEMFGAMQAVESSDVTAAAAAAAAASAEGNAAGAAAGGVSDQAAKVSCAESCTAIKEYQEAARELAAATKDQPCAAAAVAAAASGPCTAAPEVCEAVKAAAAAVERHGAGTAADFCAAAKAAEAIAAAAGSVCSGRSNLSRSATGDLSTNASYYGSRVCSPGMLTCSAARMQQRMLQRQQSNNSPTPTAAAAAAISSTLSGSSSSVQRQHQHQRAMEAVARFKKARKALMKQQAKQQQGLRQLEQARQMRVCSDMPKSDVCTRVCSSLQDARSKCLDTLGDYMLMQHMQQQQREEHLEQQLQETSSGGDSPVGGSSPALGRMQAFKNLARVSEAEGSHTRSNQSASSSKAAEDNAAAVAAAVAAAAAAAAVKTRRLPSTAQQLRLIIRRSGRKLIACRHALMTDLLLTSVLGLALGVAQGRTMDPGVSLLWMLITLLAYGCMMLTRSTISYGYERHIYLQLENQGGISVTAWVFGHQIFDMLGLLIHPALFFAWMYVLTLTPVPWWSYYIVLLVVGWYTSGLGYLVSLLVAPSNVMLSGLAVALLLGGVANGVAPRLWQLENSHPILWLDALSYTRWGLQALYISWLTPSTAEAAPPTAAFLSGLGFCGLQSSLLQSMQSSSSSNDGTSTTAAFNLTSASSRSLWNLTSAERANALASAAADNLRTSPPGSQQDAAAAAALTQLWQYYNDPALLTRQCSTEAYKAYFVLFGLGIICRLLVWIVVRSKAHHKSQE